jgi:hypothetical protein
LVPKLKTKIFPVVDFVACVVVVIPIFKTKDYLSQGSTADGKCEFSDEVIFSSCPCILTYNFTFNFCLPAASANAARYRTWGQFYVLTVAYVYVTRIAAQLLVNALDYRVSWVRDLCVELTTAAFYCAVGWMFRPVSGSEYFRLPDEEDESIELEEARDRSNAENAAAAAAAGTLAAGSLRRRNDHGGEEDEQNLIAPDHAAGAGGSEAGDWELGWENEEDEEQHR